MKTPASLFLLLLLSGCGERPAPPPGRGDPAARAVGERAFLQGDYELAAERFALAAEVGDREAAVWQGRALLKLEQWGEAERAFRASLSLPGDAGFQARLGLGDCLLARGRPAEALKPLRDLAADPAAMEALEPAALLYKTAVAELRSGDWEAAGKRLRQVAHGWPHSSWAVLAEERLADVSARRFSVQLGAYANPEAADRRIAGLRGSGIAAARLEIRRSGVLLYAIRTGSFPTYQDAKAEMVRLSGLGEDAVVVP